MSTLPQYTPDPSLTDADRMQGLIEFLSAYIEQFHGGWVRLVAFDGKRLRVEMGGACVGCTLAPNTLHGWVEGTVRQFFPGVELVSAIEAPADPNQLPLSG